VNLEILKTPLTIYYKHNPVILELPLTSMVEESNLPLHDGKDFQAKKQKKKKRKTK
jgi:hypothetical protein